MDDTIRLKSKPETRQTGYLEGQLLVATPSIQGDHFTQSVIYLFAHTSSGAMGLVLNKPLELVHYADIFSQLDIDVSGRIDNLSVVHGGPVEENRGFVLHGGDYGSDATLDQGNGLGVTATVNILRDIAHGKGPKDRLLAIGYAGWASGQLEAELEANAWITVPATRELIFGTGTETMWALAAKSLGVDMGRFSSFVGHA